MRRSLQAQYTFEQFTAIRRYQPTLAFSPDGSEVAYSTNTSGQFNLWRQASEGGYPHQLTLFTDQSVREIAWSPDGTSILFAADRRGDESTQLFRVPARGGVPEQLTQSDSAHVQYFLGEESCSPDGTAITFAGNDRDATEQDVLVRDAVTGEVWRVYQGNGIFFPGAWSPDGERMTIVDYGSNTRQDIYLLNVKTGESEHLTPRDGDVKNLSGPWAGDGSGFYLLTDEDREYQGLAFYDISVGRKRWVETPEWDIEHVVAAGNVLAWVVNEDGYSRLYACHADSDTLVDLPDLPPGVIATLAISRDGTKLGFLLARATQPVEVFVIDLATGTLAQITHGFLGGIDPVDLVEPELVRFETHDGRKIPAFLYRPQGSGPFPVLLSIHGGPEAQERPAYLYTGMYQYLLSRGIAVLAPNVRGSTGYGKTYQTLIHRDWGGGELKDFEAAVRYLHGLEWVDPERIGVFGGSFGGFATLSCVSRLPGYWAAAVDLVGPSNLVTFAKAVPPTWRRIMTEWVGDPETEADFLMERSPITYVDQITTPLFVIQGANDPRVVKPESDQMVEALRARGVEVRYDVYEDEGHGFTKRENELRAFRDITVFLEQHLLCDA